MNPEAAARKLHEIRDDMLGTIDGAPETETYDQTVSHWIRELDEALRALGKHRVCPFSDLEYKLPEDQPCPVCGVRGDVPVADIDKACREARAGKEQAA